MQYKNVKPDYLKNIWKVINWKYASDLYEKECAWGEKHGQVTSTFWAVGFTGIRAICVYGNPKAVFVGCCTFVYASFSLFWVLSVFPFLYNLWFRIKTCLVDDGLSCGTILYVPFSSVLTGNVWAVVVDIGYYGWWSQGYISERGKSKLR